jgi:hypothetical protein
MAPERKDERPHDGRAFTDEGTSREAEDGWSCDRGIGSSTGQTRETRAAGAPCRTR